MRDYGKISTSIWQSKKFTGLKSDDLRLFYFYLHTCLHVNSIGCFRLPIGYITADLKWTDRATHRAIDALSKARLIEWDCEEEVILIVKFLDESPITNKKHAAGSAKLALGLPECQLKHKVIQELQKDKFAKDLSEWNGYVYPYDSPMDTTETETEPETEPDNTLVVSKNDEKEKYRFDEFWRNYPRQRRGNKQKSQTAYKRALKENRATEDQIIEGLKSYVQSDEVKTGFAKGAEAWLNDDRWAVDYAVTPRSGNGGGSIIDAGNRWLDKRAKQRDNGGG